MSDGRAGIAPIWWWTRWAACALVLLGMALPAASWVSLSPMARYGHRFMRGVYFPNAGAQNRFFYGRHLVVERGERVGTATCVLCSITIHGEADRVETLWGDVWTEGRVESRMSTSGGRIVVAPGARIGPAAVAIGGEVSVAPGVRATSSLVQSFPGYFYPGQRSFPPLGVARFAAALVLCALCGGWLVSGAAADRIRAAAAHPFRSAAVGVAVAVLVGVLFTAAGVFLYAFPPIGILLFVASPFVPWVAVVIGVAGVSSRVGNAARLSGSAGRAGGAAILVAVMLVPVLGAAVFAAALLVALGAGVRAVA